MKNNLSQRGGGDWIGVVFLAILALVVWGILSLVGFNFNGTSEGYVNYDDCREVIEIKSNSWHTYFGTFIGETHPNLGGKYVRIVNDNWGSHTCARAYIYYKS